MQQMSFKFVYLSSDIFLVQSSIWIMEHLVLNSSSSGISIIMGEAETVNSF